MQKKQQNPFDFLIITFEVVVAKSLYYDESKRVNGILV